MGWASPTPAHGQWHGRLERPANCVAASTWGWLRPPPQVAGPRPPRRRGSSLFSLPAEPGRARSSPAEPRRAEPNADEPRRTPRPSRLRHRSAAGAAEEAPPQGEEVPARRRPPAAEAAPVAPRRERPAEAARPRGRVGGGDVAPARLLPPPPPRPPAGSRVSVGAQHSSAPDPPAGAHRAQLRFRTARRPLHDTIIECADRSASLEGQLNWSLTSEWTLPLKEPHCLRSSEGAARHGGSPLPGGSHCHRLQRPCRLLAAAALGHPLLGLPLPLCGH